MAGSVDAETAVETAVLPAPDRLSQVRCARGGFSLGRALGARDDGACQRRSCAGAGVELAGYRTPVQTELEERSDDREESRAIRPAESCATAGACHRHR